MDHLILNDNTEIIKCAIGERVRVDYTVNQVHEALKKAILTLQKNDYHLLAIDCHERSIAHRLAIYIEKQFSDFHVDCEYNRETSNPKKVSSENNEDPKSVFPDIIVHIRGTDTNILAIEVKKTSNSKATDDHDNQKLKRYHSELNYMYTSYIVVDTTDQIGNVYYDLKIER